MKLPLIFTALLCLSSAANAHDWYVGKKDPVTGGSCCTTRVNDAYGDCAMLKIEPGVLQAEEWGYRIRLTSEQAQRINPLRTEPLDALVPWDRIQFSQDGNYHLCIPRFSGMVRDEIYCFWAPGAY